MPPLVDKSQIFRVCIDDFALRKRFSYGTVMINWDTHRIIDILPSRETNEVQKWLSAYPNLKMISRDGASTYASAGRKSHPDAIQITDRFHLIKNLSEILDRYIKNTYPSRIEIPATVEISGEMETLYDTANRSKRIKYAQQKSKEGLTIQEIAYLLHSGVKTVERYIHISENEIPEDKAIVRERQHQEAIRQKQREIKLAQELVTAGKSITETAVEMHHTNKTIKNYLDPDYSPINGHYDRKRYGKITPYENEILEMRSIGKTYQEIFDEINKKGYDGSVAAIRMFMQKERAHRNSGGDESFSNGNRHEYIHRRTLTKLIYKKLEDVSLISESQYNVVIEKYTGLAEIYALVRDFCRIMFSKKPNEILIWIKNARKMQNISELQSYVEGISSDLDAVKNAIQYDYNNGLAEGSVTKIKLIKRVMYGRNSFQLLRAKVLLHELLYDKNN